MNLALSDHYAALERGIDLVEDPSYASLVVPNGNSETPVHRWYTLKESYSCAIVKRVLKDLELTDRSELSLCDPFMGSGTTAVSALTDVPDGLHRVTVRGIETNPFLWSVASTKIEGLTKPVKDLEEVRDYLADVPLDGKHRPAPELHAFQQKEYFPGSSLPDLLQLNEAISGWKGSRRAQRLARLALLSCVEPVSALRKDGRALRYVADKPRVSVPLLLEQRLDNMIADVATGTVEHAEASVARGDGRRPATEIEPESQDLVLCSPPYPNNIDYTEVYKLEAWFAGCYGDQKDFRSQRLRTMRSHPSLIFPDRTLDNPRVARAATKAIEPVLAAIPAGRYEASRRRVIEGYFGDLADFAAGTAAILKPGGSAAVVVGNSMHGDAKGPLLVATDILLARIAKAAGLVTDQIVVARRPARRSSTEPRLRESVVFLRKPISRRRRPSAP